MAASSHSPSTGLFRLSRFFFKAWDLCKLCLESWEIWRKGYFFQIITVPNVKNMFMKGVTQNHCLGLRFSCLVLSRDLRQTRLKAWPYLLELAPTLNKRRIWDKKVITATKSHGSWCHGPVIIKIKRRSVSLIPQITVSWLKQLFVVSNFQINTPIWGVKNLISDLVLIWVNMVRWLMTDQFSSMPFQSKGLTHVLTSKKNYFQHWHMSVNPKDWLRPSKF